jgi:predicted transcriptional regulator
VTISKIADQVKSKEDFVSFLQKLLLDYQMNKEDWENLELGMYIEAMKRF